MIFMRDGSRVSYAAHAFNLTEFFSNLLVLSFFIGELPNCERILQVNNRSFGAGDFEAFELAWVRSGGAVDNAKSLVGKPEHGNGGIFGFDLRVSECGDISLNRFNRGHQVTEHIYHVNGLIH